MPEDRNQNQVPDDKPVDDQPVADLPYDDDQPVDDKPADDDKLTNGKPSDDTQSDDDSGEGDGEPVKAVSELLEQLELDHEFFEGLTVPVKVDGKPAETTIGDLIKSYQITAAAEHRLEEAKQKVSKVNAELAERGKMLEGHFAVAAKLIETAEAAIDADIKSTDWTALKERDPASYAAMKQDIAERRQKVEQLKQEVINGYQGVTEALTEDQKKQLAERVTAEQEALVSAIPGWKDDKVAKAEKAKVAEYLLGQGFSQQDLRYATDHRLIVMARKAMLYDQGKTKASAAAKKVTRASKTIKPGGSQDRQPKPKSQEDIMYPNG